MCNAVAWVARDATFAGLNIINAEFVVTSTGQLAVGATDQTMPNIRFRLWNNGEWGEFYSGGGVFNTGNSRASIREMAIGAGDKLAVLFGAQGSNYIEWNGSAWIGLSGSEAAGIGTTGIVESLAIASNGNPSVTFAIGGGLERDIAYRRYDSGTWGGLDGSDSGNGLSGVGLAMYSSVAITTGNEPVVSWVKAVGNNVSVGAVRHASTTWNTIADIPLGVTTGERPGLATRGERIALAWPAGDVVKVRLWNGDEFVDRSVATRSLGNAILGNTDVTYDALERPIVAWTERVPGSPTAIYVKRFEAGAWTTLGAKGAGGRGLAEGYPSTVGIVRVKSNGSRVCVGWVAALNGQTFAMQCADL